MFSKSCEYGIRASVFIAKKSFEDKLVTPKEISEEIDSPQAFTAKILQVLVRKNIVESVRGAHGGFRLNKNSIANINLSQIVEAFDGDRIYNGCGLGLKICDEDHHCPLHNRFKSIRSDLKQMLETTSLEDLALNIKSGVSFLKV